MLGLVLHAVADELVGPGARSFNSGFSANYKSPPLPIDSKKMPKECKKFINDDGTYGEYGEIIKKEIVGQGNSTKRANLFFDTVPTNIHEICPKYGNFNPDERLNFWVWTVAAMAKDESACKDSAKNDKAGPKLNGVAVGLCQTPQLEEGRSPSWRGPGCKTPPDYSDAKQQLACCMEIIGGHLEGNYRGGPDFKRDGYTPFDKTSYWAVLRPENGENRRSRNAGVDTLSIIKEFPACK